MSTPESTDRPTFPKPSRKHALIASALSLVMPGLGQAYNGDTRKAVLWGTSIPLLAFLSTPTRLRSNFGGLVAYFVIQLSLLLLACIEAYRSGVRKTMTAQPPSPRPWPRRVMAVIVAGICIGFADYGAVASSTVRNYKVPAASMAPTIMPGDRVAVDTHYYGHHAVRRGDIVVLMGPEHRLLIKRVAGVGGDTVEGRRGKVFVDGKLFDPRHQINPALLATLPLRLSDFGPVSVPPKEEFVLGDNRAASWDSRSPEFGLVHRSSVKGRVLYIYWSRKYSQIGKELN